MIPQIVHYCWFGSNPLPELAVKCIESWKRYCPDYEIKEWNESNFDINVCNYVKEAYAEGKWAFVSDYARFWILYHEGGIYFDTDVELIKSIADLLEKGSFMGCELVLGADNNKNPLSRKRGLGPAVAPGLGLAAAPRLGLYREILDFYNQKSFYRKNGAVDLTTVVTNVTSILKMHGWQPKLEIQYIENIYIYPPEYFCPINYSSGEMTITENTKSIHHYLESWMPLETQKINHMMKELIRRFGETKGYRIWCIYAFPYRLRRKLRNVGVRGTFIFAIKKMFGKQN